ncbi:MAG: helix-turn-helix domain-containing protein [Gammaproteobacteria bacterium]|nr:helix-turn-helix domain-containing protein [Gammaproteobacteria bacterium]
MLTEKKRAFVEAYLSGGYTLKDVGKYFGMHYTTVSRIVKAWESM